MDNIEYFKNCILYQASGNVMALYKIQNPAAKEIVTTEHHIYGSSRLGIATGRAETGQLQLGLRNYELSNHLGNVLAVITDNVNMTSDTQNSEWYDSKAWPSVVTTNDYYPFRLQMEGRKVQGLDYRYGFNGKEIDNWNPAEDAPPSGGGPLGPPPDPTEPVVDPNSGIVYNYGFRIYNPTIGKFLSVDPLRKSYPWYTPYQFASNIPILGVDLDGLEFQHNSNYQLKRTYGKTVLERELSYKLFVEYQNPKWKEMGYEPASPAGNDDFCPCICSGKPKYENTQSLGKSKFEDAAEIPKDVRMTNRKPRAQNVDRTIKGKVHKGGSSIDFFRQSIGVALEFSGENARKKAAFNDKSKFYAAINLVDNFEHVVGLPEWANNEESKMHLKNWVNAGSVPFNDFKDMNDADLIESYNYNRKIRKLGKEIFNSRIGWYNGSGTISTKKGIYENESNH